MSRDLRPELPRPPAQIALLPVRRGYPVPWFVAWLDEQGKPCRRGEGEPDFRVIFPGAIEAALKDERCWVCGQRLVPPVAFLVGPMCAVNRVSAEPPSHVVCADWSARACPFLTRPHAHRREAGLPGEAVDPPGIMLVRNPGVALVWLTRTPTYRPVGDGVLFDLGEAVQTRWYADGRRATHEEVLASIESGLPALLELASADGKDALRELELQLGKALELVP